MLIGETQLNCRITLALDKIIQKIVDENPTQYDSKSMFVRSCVVKELRRMGHEVGME